MTVYSSEKKMAFRYRIYNRVNNNQDIYNMLGALILMGGMILILGLLVFNLEMMTIGSGMLMFGSCCHVTFLEKYYYEEVYRGTESDELESGQASE